MHASPWNAWIVNVVFLMLFASVGAASAGVWVGILRRRIRGLPVVEFEPRRPVPWTAVEVVLIVAGYLFLQVAAMQVVFGLTGLEIRRPHGERSPHSAEPEEEPEEPKAMDPERYTAMLLANVLGNVLTAAATLVLLRSDATPRLRVTRWGRSVWFQSRSAATWSDLGLSRPNRHDLVLGLAAFAAAVIPVCLMQAVLTQFTDKRHPIVEMLEEHMNFGLMAVSVLTAVFVAPFVEELLFRVALQGWLERVQMRAQTSAIEPLDPSAAGQEDVAALDQQRLPGNRLMPWPIVISSLAFALAHWGNGPDPIPLFFLALVLGYVYQRTHRLWPSLVVHFTLNSCSMFVLWLQAISK